MNYGDIKKIDVANGPGVRVSLFVSGCTHHCKGCFNPETWDFSFGKPFTDETIDEIIEALAPDYIAGFSLLGGEPFERANQKALLPLLRKIRETYPHKTIWCYSGYTLDKDIFGFMYDNWDETPEFISYIDVLVDGEFVEELKDLKLRFRGSANQRILDVQQSIESDEIVLYLPGYEKDFKENA